MLLFCKVLFLVSFCCGVDILGQSCDEVNDRESKRFVDSTVDKVNQLVDDQGQDIKQEGLIAPVAKEVSALDVIVIALGKNCMQKSLAISDHLTFHKDGIAWFKICEKICRCQDHLVYFGGHLWLLWDVVAVLLGFLPSPSAADTIAHHIYAL